MNRSKRFVFVPFCLLAQGVRASGIVRVFPAIVNPVLKVLEEQRVNVVQMPCPELVFDSLHRRPCGISKYDTSENRAVCRRVAQPQVEMMKTLVHGGCNISAVLGLENSPSCAVRILLGPHRSHLRGTGIFMDELISLMNSAGIKPPLVGVRIYHIPETLTELNQVLQAGLFPR